MKARDKTLYIDASLGISGDMFSAACYGFMGDASRDEYSRRASRGCREIGGTIELREHHCGSEQGYAVSYVFLREERCVSAGEAGGKIERIARELGLSEDGGKFAMSIFSDIIRAEADAHGVGTDAVHLHEIGRPAGLFNIASAGLCYDLLGLGKRGIVGSVISVGRGVTMTEHGRLRVPTPASAYLLTGLKSKAGPFDGEMATPTGIAIVKNLISDQTENLPAPGRQGVGFGSKSFEGVIGYTRLFEKGEPVE